jgi:hypothetical protein
MGGAIYIVSRLKSGRGMCLVQGSWVGWWFNTFRISTGVWWPYLAGCTLFDTAAGHDNRKNEHVKSAWKVYLLPLPTTSQCPSHPHSLGDKTRKLTYNLLQQNRVDNIHQTYSTWHAEWSRKIIAKWNLVMQQTLALSLLAFLSIRYISNHLGAIAQTCASVHIKRACASS